MKALIDSCVWIDYLRENDRSLCDQVDELLDADLAYINSIVMGEVLMGTKDESVFEMLKDTFHGLHLLDDTCDISSRAARLGFQLRREGITVPLTDLFIATQCEKHGLQLITRDRHFDLISTVSDFNYKLISP